jgi:hypothetical protein
MARFPERESDIRALAQSIITGLTDNAAVYPAPPVTAIELQANLDSLITLCDDCVAAQAAAQQATIIKNAGLEELIDAMKALLRYAENTVNFDDALLALLGWAGRAAAAALAVPGQCRILEAPSQGEGWIFLDWKKPADGGAVASYKIERRERPSGDWTIADLALLSEATLTSQERGKDWEYRVIAVNMAGEGVPSNTVAAVV